ncbi:glycine--tRNA ligase [Methanobrevibacter arboriphilus]|jgi:glycyl-tRNA synthetase|uniref:glycine--tRNA ligase n=1 Tax=Methanobrevibacter arboriphilus TaxID=39441 RepID=UPI0022EDA35E|nr:glycine--tRNA ligase [Methanobrevibacter arboriphilus]GLI12735.1 glycine--tRNA ligase [Methanobrevibacter arboriphilus]
MNHEKMINISTKRGFLWPSFEIYSGVSGFTDYGPLGAILKNNIMQLWRKQYIAGEGFYEIESPTVTPEEVLKASGHVDNFTDPMAQCDGCKDVFRADHIIEEVTNLEVEGMTNEELDKIVKKHNVNCPNCGDKLSQIWNYNLMFKTNIGAKGNKTGYMRPETAQGIFILFKRLSRFFKNKLPFGTVQLGKAYRNEISPRQGVIRLREFTQAEAEIFVDPENKTHPKFNTIADEKLVLNSQKTQIEGKDPITISAKEALENGIVANEILIYQIYLAKKFLKELGIPDEVLRFRQHLPNEMAHYAIDCWDVEVKTDRYGWVEIIGIADRGDYDLKSHSKHSNEELNIFIQYEEPKIISKTIAKPNMAKFGPSFKQNAPKVKSFLENIDSVMVEKIKTSIKKDGIYEALIDGEAFEIKNEHVTFEDVEEEIKGKKIIPHVIEPSFGIDRILYSVLLHSFHTAETEEDKEYFKLANSIAPIQVGVFPLMNKSELNSLATEITTNLRNSGFMVDYDTSGTIGKRYARADEIGVPIAITIDYDSLEDNSVTIRDRDTEEQERVSIKNLKKVVGNYFN